MSAGRIRKQPSEEIDYALDFSERLEDADMLELTSCTSVDLKTGEDSSQDIIAANPAPAVDGQTITFRLAAGVNGGRHKLTIKVLASTGEILEDDLDIFIIED